MSTLAIDTIQGATTAANVKFPADNIVQVIKTDDFEDTLEKNKNIHNMTSNIIDDLNETTKKKCKKKSEQSHIEEFMMLSDDD